MKQPTLLFGLAAILAVLLLFALLLPKKSPETTPETIQTTHATAPENKDNKQVGICLPSQDQAWLDTGDLLRQKLEDRGYGVELAYGDGTPAGQAGVLTALIDKKVDCLITSPADSAALTEAEATAKEAGIPILAYGALLMDTNAVSGYICYDYYNMGAAIARYITEKLSLETAAGDNRGYTIELFMGAPKDFNALLLHKGLLSVLQSYLDTGVLTAKSGRVAFEDCCTVGWSQDTAIKNAMSRLEHNYPESAPDVCICASDAIASGVITALDTAGVPADNWPIITGNGGTQSGMQALYADKQTLTVQTDPAEPAEACCQMVDYVLFGATPSFPLTDTVNNVISVPTALCGFELIHK